MAGAVGAAGVVGLGDALTSDAAVASQLPAPQHSGIDHIVVVMMENRSFDHFLGWVPGADGKQAGLTFTDRLGRRRSTFHQTKFNSCGFNDPDHSYEGGRIELNGGALRRLAACRPERLAVDQLLQAGRPLLPRQGRGRLDDLRSLLRGDPGRDLPEPLLPAQREDRPAAQLDDHLDDADDLGPAQGEGTHRHVLLLRHPVPRAVGHEVHLDRQAVRELPHRRGRRQRCRTSRYIDPRFEDEDSGSSADDHPHADIRAGEAFLNQVYTAVTTGAKWANTLLVINYDEWGGFYDHVAPGIAPDAHPWTARRGFRVPAIVISPHAKARVNHTVFDHTSILRAIEWRWGLKPLTRRDAHANNIVSALDFSTTRTPPSYGVITPPPPTDCSAPTTGATGESTEWSGLKKLALREGWVLPS